MNNVYPAYETVKEVPQATAYHLPVNIYIDETFIKFQGTMYAIFGGVVKPLYDTLGSDLGEIKYILNSPQSIHGCHIGKSKIKQKVVEHFIRIFILSHAQFRAMMVPKYYYDQEEYYNVLLRWLIQALWYYDYSKITDSNKVAFVYKNVVCPRLFLEESEKAVHSDNLDKTWPDEIKITYPTKIINPHSDNFYIPQIKWTPVPKGMLEELELTDILLHQIRNEYLGEIDTFRRHIPFDDLFKRFQTNGKFNVWQLEDKYISNLINK